jgi:hypothetical protein
VFAELKNILIIKYIRLVDMLFRKFPVLCAEPVFVPIFIPTVPESDFFYMRFCTVARSQKRVDCKFVDKIRPNVKKF